MLLYFFVFVLISEVFAHGVFRRNINYKDIHTEHECKDIFPYELDVGIYWAAIDKGEIVWEKSCAGDDDERMYISKYFNPNAPTKLLVHGLQPRAVENNERFGDYSKMDMYYYPLLLQGYNIGTFMWTQFADGLVEHFETIEGKIYTTDFLGEMQYTKLNGKNQLVMSDGRKNETVSDIFLRHYSMHFPKTEDPPELEIVGHSLGCQVASFAIGMLVTNQVKENVLYNDVRLPNAVTLLDLVGSPGRKPYFRHQNCGSHEDISNNLRCFFDEFYKHKIVTTYFSSSPINDCLFSEEPFYKLLEHVAFVKIKMNDFGNYLTGSCHSAHIMSSLNNINKYLKGASREVALQHCMIVPYYYHTFYDPPKRCVLIKNKTSPWVDKHDHICQSTGELAISGAMSISQRSLWASGSYFLKNKHNFKEKLCLEQWVNRSFFESYIGFEDDWLTHPGQDLFYAVPCDKFKT